MSKSSLAAILVAAGLAAGCGGSEPAGSAPATSTSAEGGAMEAKPGSDDAAMKREAAERTSTKEASGASAMKREAAERTRTKQASGTSPMKRDSRAGGAELMVGDDPALGRILVDGRGQALYLFDREGTGRSECYGGVREGVATAADRGRSRRGRGGASRPARHHTAPRWRHAGHLRRAAALLLRRRRAGAHAVPRRRRVRRTPARAEG